MLHTPASKPAHEVPHMPQLFASVFVLASHPLAAFPSQSAYGAVQAHVPDGREQVWFALQVTEEGFEQTPVAGMHVPTPWHASLAMQVTGLLPVQLPNWHV